MVIWYFLFRPFSEFRTVGYLLLESWFLSPTMDSVMVVAPQAESARARSEKRIAIFREGWRGPLWQERFHPYPMDERKGLESFMKSKVSVFSVYYLRSDPIDASFSSISGSFWPSYSMNPYRLSAV